jgi:hypothetical protein
VETVEALLRRDGERLEELLLLAAMVLLVVVVLLAAMVLELVVELAIHGYVPSAARGCRCLGRSNVLSWCRAISHML